MPFPFHTAVRKCVAPFPFHSSLEKWAVSLPFHTHWEKVCHAYLRSPPWLVPRACPPSSRNFNIFNSMLSYYSIFTCKYLNMFLVLVIIASSFDWNREKFWEKWKIIFSFSWAAVLNKFCSLVEQLRRPTSVVPSPTGKRSPWSSPRRILSLSLVSSS